jgi:NTE family protein
MTKGISAPAAVEPSRMMAAETELENHADLVLEGGGVKGIGLAGAYAALQRAGYLPRNVAGTSAGAIIAALIAAGYSADEISAICIGLDLREFEDKGREDRVGGAGLSLLLDSGIYEGNRFRDWMREMLAAKGVHTFADLQTGADDPRLSSRLQVVVSDISARSLLVLPRDAGVLGLDPLELEVATAVRMSMSIPIFFEPVRVLNKNTNHEHVLVDGALLSNFPVWLFDCDDGVEPECPTIGLLLVEPDPRTPITERLETPEHAPRGPRRLVTLLSSIVHTLLEAHDRMYLEKAQFVRTITIPTLGVRTTEVDLSKDRAQALYEAGYSAGNEFLETWDFAAYRAAFRSGRPQSRREDLTGELMKRAEV